MCREASFVVTKKKVYWSLNSDSHEDIIEEFKLGEFNVRGQVNFVRVEIVPAGNDYTLPIRKWRFNLDQDILPTWWDRSKYEKSCRDELKLWAKAKIIKKNCSVINGNHIIISGRATLYNNSRATLYNNSRAALHDDSQAVLHDDSQATLLGNSRAALHDDSRATLYGNSRAILHGNSRAVLHDDSQATLLGNSHAALHDDSRAVLYEDSQATLYDNSFYLRGQSIYHCSDYKLVKV